MTIQGAYSIARKHGNSTVRVGIIYGAFALEKRAASDESATYGAGWYVTHTPSGFLAHNKKIPRKTLAVLLANTLMEIGGSAFWFAKWWRFGQLPSATRTARLSEIASEAAYRLKGVL